MEHLNKYANHAFVIWGQTSFQEVSIIFKSIGTVDAIVTKFEIATYMSHHGVVSRTEDVKMIYND